MSKKCEYCGGEFEPKYPAQKYCSRKCYLEYRKSPAVAIAETEVVKESSDKLIKKEEIPEEGVWEPIEPIEELKPINKEFPEGLCPICGSPIYCGRCVRFTQHSKLKKK